MFYEKSIFCVLIVAIMLFIVVKIRNVRLFVYVGMCMSYCQCFIVECRPLNIVILCESLSILRFVTLIKSCGLISLCVGEESLWSC